MKLTKLIMIVIMFIALFAFTNESKAQNLTSSISSIQDSVTLAGSTSAGSRWFPVGGGDAVFLELYNGAYWRTYEIDYPPRLMNSVRVYINGADTTVKVQANMEGAYICLPLKVTAGTLVNDIDYGGALTITSPALVRFKKVRK